MSERSLPRREALRIVAAVGLSSALGIGLVGGLVRSGRLRRVRQTRTRMGTIVTITVVHPDGGAARDMVDGAFAELTRLEGILTRHRPEAPLGRLNRAGRLDDAPAELLHVLGAGLELAERSGGAFDPTVLPLLRLWEAAGAAGRRPDSTELRAAHARVGWQRVRVVDRSVELEAGTEVTLDGIAKGYVVDRTVAALVGAGAERAMVDAGGDVATGGIGSSQDPWTVAVQAPRTASAADVVRLGGGAIATSGDYLHSFTADRTHHHILDPRTGASPDGTASASVVAGRAMDADGLSTAVLVLGAADGLALLERTPGTGGLLVDKAGREWRTRGFSDAVV